MSKMRGVVLPVLVTLVFIACYSACVPRSPSGHGGPSNGSNGNGNVSTPGDGSSDNSSSGDDVDNSNESGDSVDNGNGSGTGNDSDGGSGGGGAGAGSGNSNSNSGGSSGGGGSGSGGDGGTDADGSGEDDGGSADADGDGAPDWLQVFPPDNPWNQDISAFPVHENSDNYLASMGLDTGLHPDFGTVYEGAPIGIPYVTVDANQPLVPVSFYYADESDPGPYPIPPNAPIEGGADSDGDRHVIVVAVENKLIYELFDAHPRSDGGWDAGSGAIFDMTSNALRPAGWTSADAAGLCIFAGLVRYDEVVDRGEITHALRFTVSQTQRAYIEPATHFASSSTNPNHPPMGLRVRLKADYDISSFTPNVQVILRALKKYGMFVADNGSNWYITGAPDSRWDDDELHDLGQVKGRDFEVVYTGEVVGD